MTTPIQSQYNAVIATTSITTTLGSTPQAGSLLIAILTSNGTIATPVHPWGVAPDVLTTVNPVCIYSRIVPATPTEPTAVTFSNTSARNFGLTVMEIPPDSGKLWAGFDQSATSTGTTVNTLAVGPTPTQTNPDDFAVAGIAASGAINTATPTMSNGYTVVGGLAAVARGFAGYLQLASNAATSTTGSWTSPMNCNGALATYKQSTPPTLSANLNVTTTLTAGGSTGASGAASLAILSSRVAAGFVGRIGTASLSLFASRVATGSVGSSNAANLALRATLTAAAVVSGSSGAALPLRATLTASGTVTVSLNTNDVTVISVTGVKRPFRATEHQRSVVIKEKP